MIMTSEIPHPFVFLLILFLRGRFFNVFLPQIFCSKEKLRVELSRSLTFSKRRAMRTINVMPHLFSGSMRLFRTDPYLVMEKVVVFW